MIRTIAAVLAAAGLVGAATPSLTESAAGGSGDHEAVLRSGPSAEDLVESAPEGNRADRGGRATMACTVTVEGRLRDCSVVDETPVGAGFGPAALALAARFTYEPAVRGGRPIESSVRTPVQFPSFAYDGPGDRAPNWLRRPTREDLFALWPAAAIRAGVGGSASIVCTVTVQGALDRCRVAAEDPPGMGFGPAALAMSTQFTMRPALKAGQPVPSRVRIPMNFPQPGPELGHLVRGRLPEMTQRTVRGIRWSAAPSFAEVSAAYPAAARSARIGGAAAFDCTIGRDGSLGHCDVISEEPRNRGFAGAARRLIPRFRTPTDQSSPLPLVGAHIQLRVAFPLEALEAGGQTIGQPQWAARPQGRAPGSGYPAAAVAAHIEEARIVLECRVAGDGHLQGCTVVENSQPNYGFGEAALALATEFVMTLWTDDGLPTVGARVRVPVRYRLPPGEPPAPQAAQPAPSH